VLNPEGKPRYSTAANEEDTSIVRLNASGRTEFGELLLPPKPPSQPDCW
jgi:hypothetical protein